MPRNKFWPDDIFEKGPMPETFDRREPMPPGPDAPAYPGRDYESRPYWRGLTTRQVYAIAALPALIKRFYSGADSYAHRAFEIADAMLAHEANERKTAHECKEQNPADRPCTQPE